MLKNPDSYNISLQSLYEPVADEFTQVNDFILNQLHSDASLIDDIDEHIFQIKGKRLRPLLVLLTAHACGYEGREHIALAAIIEFLHTATLLHDDVVDVSSMRRGRKTANQLWGNAPSVLVGDFIYSRAFQLMVSIGSMDVMRVLSQATNVIAEGEVLQLMNIKNTTLTHTQYMDVVYRKTAMLFEASSHTAAILSNTPSQIINAMQTYGKHLGLAFQLVDDVLDYTGDMEIMGKNAGEDLNEGKITLPLLYLIHHGTPAQSSLVKKAVETSDASLFEDVFNAVNESGAVSYTMNEAKKQMNLTIDALNILDNSIFRKTLHNLAVFSVFRNK